jgi:aminopeptidase YwaD
MKFVRTVALVLVTGSIASIAMAQQTWTVKPEWVRAHEEFLASDVMQGRGSATRDEEITATYVASEFMGYGLKPAPGMSGYVQSAEVLKPLLNGHSVLKAGDETFAEGKDYDLVLSGGVSRNGRLLPVEMTPGAQFKDLEGDVVALTELPSGMKAMQAAGAVMRAGPAVVIIPEDDSSDKMFTMFGGKTRVPVKLKEDASKGGEFTVVAMNTAALARLKKVKAGQPVTLTLYGVVQSAPRQTFNAIGYLPGSDPNAGTILLSAHLDHLGVGKPVNGDAIFNGANDDAAGTTAVLELAHALASGPKPKRSVLFVCYGSEEAGELGSTYFAPAGAAEGFDREPGVRDDRQPGPKDAEGRAVADGMGSQQSWADTQGTRRTAGA